MVNNFKIRCSGIGKIMTNGKKAGELGQTCKTFLETWAKEQIYQRRHEVTSKYMDKGLNVEDDSIAFIAKHLNLGQIRKNEQSFENDFMTGTPDVILPNEIIDIKSSWDAFTFPLFEQDLENNDYYWQMQGYMCFTDKPKARVVYVLMNTPKDIVDREIRNFFWNKDEIDSDVVDAIQAKHSYDSIPAKYRIKDFAVYKNDEDIEKIKARVLECRNYILSL